MSRRHPLPLTALHRTASVLRLWSRLLGLLALVLMAGLLSGCRPPTAQQIDQWTMRYMKSLQGVQPVFLPKPPFMKYKTEVIEGVEVMVSPYPVGQFGGTFKAAAMGNGPQTFNPWAAYDATSTEMGERVFAGLTNTDAYTGEVIPYLAKTIELKPDKKTYRVTLRKGLSWSDGKPLTADDVMFTWNVIMRQGLGNPSTRDGLLVDGKFPAVKQIDKLTVEFVTAKPFAPFLRNLATPIAPKHIVAPVLKREGERGFTALWNPEEIAKNPKHLVGCGLWRLANYKHGQEVVYERNPYSFIVDREGQRLPYLDRYLVRFVKDQNAELLLYEQGELDTMGVPAALLNRVRRLRKFPQRVYDLGPTSSSTFISFNQTRRVDPYSKKPMVDPVRQRWFQDTRFRVAMDWAIDRDKLVANVLRGVGAPLFTPEPINGIFVNPALVKGHPYNPQKARDLLRESGFTWRPKDGVLLDKDGSPVRFTLMTNAGNAEREQALVSIQQDLKKLGILVDLRPLDFNVLVGRITQGNWEAMLLGLTGSPLEPNGGKNVWMSDGALHMFHQRFPAKPGQPAYNPPPTPWEKTIDDVFERGAQELNLPLRKRLYWAYQDVVAKEAPFIYLFSPRQLMAVRRRIRNFYPTPLGAFHNMESLWLQERVTLPEGVRVEGFDPEDDNAL